MSKAVLEIEAVYDATRATRGIDSTADSFANMGREVEKASRATETSASRLNATADAADGLDSKASQATGSLGALSSGFELVGAEKYATGLQSAALATDFLSGVGAALNLVTNATAVANIRATATTVAQSAASKAAAASQWLLNTAMMANPVGLVVLAVVALVAGFVVLYKRSETFRNIVQAVGRAGKAAIGGVVDTVSDLAGWVGNAVPAGFRKLQSAGVTAFNVVTAPQRAAIRAAMDLYGWVHDKIPQGFDEFKSKGVAAGNAILSPFRSLNDLVERLLNKIKNIKLPDLPGIDIPGFRVATAGVPGGGGGLVVNGGDQVTYQLTINGATDPEATARVALSGIRRMERRLGRRA